MNATEDPAEVIGHEYPGARPMMCSPSIAGLANALAQAQGEFQTIPRDRTVTVQLKDKQTGAAKGSYTFRYAPLETILEKTRPALSKAGLALVQFPVMVEERGAMVEMLRTVLLFGEEWLACDVPVFQGTGDNRSQAYASGVTYSRRYGVTLLLCVAADEDDDGNGGEQGEGRTMPDYTRTQPEPYRGQFPRNDRRDDQPRGPRQPQRRQQPGGATHAAQAPGGRIVDQRPRDDQPRGPRQPPIEDSTPPADDFPDDPLPDFGLSQFGGDGSGDRNPPTTVQHDADGVVTSPWGPGLSAGEMRMAKSRAEVAGMSDADVLKLCGVIDSGNIAQALAKLKGAADRALDAGG